jgi:hypothetical protein
MPLQGFSMSSDAKKTKLKDGLFSILNYVKECCDFQFSKKGRGVLWIKDSGFLLGLTKLLKSCQIRHEEGGNILINVERGGGIEEIQMQTEYDDVKIAFYFIFFPLSIIN